MQLIHIALKSIPFFCEYGNSSRKSVICLTFFQVIGVIFDDSSGDEDLLEDPSEAPSAKQAGASLMALKTSFFLCLTRVLAVVILVTLPRSSAGLACITVIVSLLRFPINLLVSILNFRPLRNKVGLYVENLPDRIEELLEPMPDWCQIARCCCCYGGAAGSADDRYSLPN